MYTDVVRYHRSVVKYINNQTEVQYVGIQYSVNYEDVGTVCGGRKDILYRRIDASHLWQIMRSDGCLLPDSLCVWSFVVGSTSCP